MGKTIEELRVGDAAGFTKTISEVDIYLYAGLTSDFNPIHIDEEYAKGSLFKKRVAHGMLTIGFISAVIGTKLPGPGTVYVRQGLEFLAPVYPGDTITARVEVSEIMFSDKRVRLRTNCINQNGKMVLDGEAIVSPPRR